MNNSPSLAIQALLALWLGLTVYLFLVAEPRPLGWAIIGPIGLATTYFAAQWFRARRVRRNKADKRGGDHPTR